MAWTPSRNKLISRQWRLSGKKVTALENPWYFGSVIFPNPVPSALHLSLQELSSLEFMTLHTILYDFLLHYAENYKTSYLDVHIWFLTLVWWCISFTVIISCRRRVVFQWWITYFVFRRSCFGRWNLAVGKRPLLIIFQTYHWIRWTTGMTQCMTFFISCFAVHAYGLQLEILNFGKTVFLLRLQPSFLQSTCNPRLPTF